MNDHSANRPNSSSVGRPTYRLSKPLAPETRRSKTRQINDQRGRARETSPSPKAPKATESTASPACETPLDQERGQSSPPTTRATFYTPKARPKRQLLMHQRRCSSNLSSPPASACNTSGVAPVRIPKLPSNYLDESIEWTNSELKKRRPAPDLEKAPPRLVTEKTARPGSPERFRNRRLAQKLQSAERSKSEVPASAQQHSRSQPSTPGAQRRNIKATVGELIERYERLVPSRPDSSD